MAKGKFEITKEMGFKFQKELKIGHIRADFNDGDKNPFNRWFANEDIQVLTDKHDIDLKEVQEAVNYVMFEHFSTWDKLVEACGGTGYDKETNYFGTHGKCNYWIRLLPCKGDYNMYINVYAGA